MHCITDAFSSGVMLTRSTNKTESHLLNPNLRPIFELQNTPAISTNLNWIKYQLNSVTLSPYAPKEAVNIRKENKIKICS